MVNEFVICFFITIGSYQALCNIWRVYNYDTSVLPVKVSKQLPLVQH